MNCVLESVVSSTDMIHVFAVMVEESPAVTPTVPVLSGERKLAVTHAWVASPIADIVLPLSVMLPPAVNVSCLPLNDVLIELVVV